MSVDQTRTEIVDAAQSVIDQLSRLEVNLPSMGRLEGGIGSAKDAAARVAAGTSRRALTAVADVSPLVDNLTDRAKAVVPVPRRPLLSKSPARKLFAAGLGCAVVAAVLARRYTRRRAAGPTGASISAPAGGQG
jgi:hypothetical protein